MKMRAFAVRRSLGSIADNSFYRRIPGSVVVVVAVVVAVIFLVVGRGGRPGVESLGEVVFGHGNDGKSGQEGCLWRNVVGTYIHGPLLPKNPGVADWLIARALMRKYATAELEPLDDADELEANRVMYERMAGADRRRKRLWQRRQK